MRGITSTDPPCFVDAFPQSLRHQASRAALPQQAANAGGTNANLYAASPSLRNKASMPDLSHLHGPAVARDPARAILSQRSTMNLREGYGTVGSAAGRRSQTNPSSAFQDQQQQLLQPPGGPYQAAAAKGSSESTDSLLSTESGPPNVASTAAAPTGAANGPAQTPSPGSLLRQPRGPPAVNVSQGGFGGRRLVAPGSSASRLGSPGAGLADVPQQQQQQQRTDDNFATSHEPLEF